MSEPAVAGRTVVVTGGASGIGAEYARAFAERGARVVVADVLADEGSRLARELGEDVAFVECDVADEAAVEALVATAADRFGGIDALVNNAGLYRALDSKRSSDEIAVEEWDRVMAVNARGAWLCTRAAARSMRERGGGSVVNISSATVHMGVEGFPHYVASKAAVIGLTRALARELGPSRITVNAVAPGLVANESSRALNADEYVAAAAAARAIGRDMAPGDLVGAVLFLASPESAFVTGQTLVVDGGGVMQ
jgi:NAD(P)-dependent dehydrogenase (short-subunit alcohol dehydrogenase family)